MKNRPPRAITETARRTEIVVGEAGRDRDDLVGDRRQALEQDDPGAVFGIGGAKRLDLVAVAVKLDQPLADRVVEQRADGISHMPPATDVTVQISGVEPRVLRPRERHRNQHHIRRASERTSFPRTTQRPSTRGHRACRRRRYTSRTFVSAWRDEPPSSGFVYGWNCVESGGKSAPLLQPTAFARDNWSPSRHFRALTEAFARVLA